MNSLYTIKDLADTHALAFTETRCWTEAEITTLLNSPFVFLSGDSRCFALVRVIADEAELLTLATHPEYQRKGLATNLMPIWQAAAQSRGAEQAFLEVAADNIAALALYQSQRFAISGRRNEYYARKDGVLVDAVLMQRTFSPLAK
ncbi:GNAT family N-acetyltransferase [Epibacterium ulvae]|uniref:Ribosomal-protein-alanine N-acetyltransferase n=1 Tax=Epibacterium ulvae TaxID=1156985 RepID=A0A1G5PLS6_9RHOB|nr:GNAT family N-acetyltransferase [Epibacterium ulvae]SCZ50326.1 ribosomal-protein-alanine N-acetyltransferase [Epibacterium ulvae]